MFGALLERAGFDAPLVVEAQAKPDADFPTAAFPNPEEPGVLDLALDLARRHRADLVLAHDPDADRLAVAIPEAGDWRVLTGDETGALLGAHMLASSAGDDRVVARSVVSSRLLDRIAAAAGVPARSTLTGFKWISRAGDTDGRRLVFGYEEALGYAVTPARARQGRAHGRPRDRRSSCTRLTDGCTDGLRARTCLHATAQWSLRFDDNAAASAFIAGVRATPPVALGGVAVTSVRDYALGARGLPPADLLELVLADDSRVLLRPSGTEPKLKCYFEVVEASRDARGRRPVSSIFGRRSRRPPVHGAEDRPAPEGRVTFSWASAAVAFDGDDTLWHNEGLFSMTQDRFRALLADAVEGDVLDARLLETERENVAVYGYGVKGFTLSMIETAIEVTNGNVAADRIYQILSFAKDQLSHPVELLPHVTETLDALAGRYRLLLITKGDLFDQESKIARSGLAERFDAIEVVPEKEPDIYRRILERHGIGAAEFLMVGNSVRSDVLPVLEVGGRAALVPYHLTWELEVAEPPRAHDGYWEIEHIGQVPALIDELG